MSQNFFNSASDDAEFAAALLNSAAALPADIRACNRVATSRRFAIYRNNVMVTLIDALADCYPVVNALVGEEFFRTMAREFAGHHFPSSPIMAEYGNGFAEFIETFAPAATLPYLSDMARLEWQRVSASAIDLFRDEYRLPFVPPEIAAPMAAISEHIFAALLLIGLASRFAALALLGLTMVIQVFVYPDAYPTHGVWATVLLFIVARGPGIYSLDHLIAERYADCNR
jgi:uncharacterized membrane protein YphA (DoxX/SURF4 family)